MSHYVCLWRWFPAFTKPTLKTAVGGLTLLGSNYLLACFGQHPPTFALTAFLQDTEPVFLCEDTQKNL